MCASTREPQFISLGFAYQSSARASQSALIDVIVAVIKKSEEERIRVVLMTTAPEALHFFLRRQAQSLAEHGYEVHTISSPGFNQFTAGITPSGTHHELPMKRTISPFNDIRSLCALWCVLRRIRPHIVQTHTPKAGLLGMLAAYSAAVPIRIYTMNGLAIRLQNPFGAIVLSVTERIACALSTEVLCVSRSVRRLAIAYRFCRSRKCSVLGDGGSHGVDLSKFDGRLDGIRDRKRVRREYHISDDAIVIGYVGRMVPGKGINELALAWSLLRDKFPTALMLLCGYCEPEHPMQGGVLERLRNDPRVRITDKRVLDMPSIYAAIDVVVLPSYCEGLPNVALEAAAMKVPIIATRVPGCVDAIRNNVTGLLVEPKNHKQLVSALEFLIRHPERREAMGRAAREFIAKRFSEIRISTLILTKYREITHCIDNRPSRSASQNVNKPDLIHD